MNQIKNQPNDSNNPNLVWQEGRKNKEMRLWEFGGKGTIAEGWWLIKKKFEPNATEPIKKELEN